MINPVEFDTFELLEKFDNMEKKMIKEEELAMNVEVLQEMYGDECAVKEILRKGIIDIIEKKGENAFEIAKQAYQDYLYIVEMK